MKEKIARIHSDAILNGCNVTTSTYQHREEGMHVMSMEGSGACASCALTPARRQSVDVVRVRHAHLHRMSRSSLVLRVATQRHVARKLRIGKKKVRNADTK